MSWTEVGFSQGTSGDGSKVEFLKIEGTVRIRLLDEEPVTYWNHWIPQIGQGKGGSVDCIGRGCPICKIIAEDKKNKRPKKYGSSKKHLINVLDRATGTVKLLDAGETVFEQLKNIMIQNGDLRKFDVTITKTGAGKQTKYSVLPTFPPTELTDAEKALPRYDLSTARKPLTVEQINELLTGKSYKEVLGANNAESADAPNFADGEPTF